MVDLEERIAALTGIDYWTAIRRVARGWPPDKAVTHPIRKKVA